MSSTAVGWIIAIAALLILLRAAIRVFPEYERGVIFRLGRVIGAKGPGLFFIIPIVDRVVRVSLRTVTRDIPPQDVITKDNVTVRVNAVTYFNVIDPVSSVVAIENYVNGTFQIAQTTLRSILGQVDLDELLTKRDEINQRLRRIVDEVTEPWGVKVTLVEIKDVELPDSMRRAMAIQAQAERERRGKVIHAQGEFQAAADLARAAELLETHPAALQLRVLGTMVEVSAERNSTLIFPVPVEMLRLVETVRRHLDGDGGPPSAPPLSDGGPPSAPPVGESPPSAPPVQG
jgi:regulator of protease activity HflC (stomatin/prohibitin superfamily)